MTISTRDQRLSVYAFSDSTPGTGRTTDTWTLVGTYWGRRMDWRGKNKQVQGAPEEEVTAVLAFGDDAGLTSRNVVMIGDPGQAGPVFKVLYTQVRTHLRELHCFASLANRADYPGVE